MELRVLRGIGIPQRGPNPRVRGVLAVIQALGVDPEQNFYAVPGSGRHYLRDLLPPARVTPRRASGRMAYPAGAVTRSRKRARFETAAGCATAG